MRLTCCSFALAITTSSVCLAQPWELAATGGSDGITTLPSLTLVDPAQAGIPPPKAAAIGMTFMENMYNYVGGEIRNLFRFGGPELKSSG
jgi:hypothetical protein